jgi:NADPH:quinone reductase-like Zn-dependent oxidoreductase
LMVLSEIEDPPSPQEGQLLIKVLSMALNPADYKLPEQWPMASRLLFGRPLVPGLDFCGQVVNLPASGAPKDLQPDQIVFGRMEKPGKFGPLAEYALVPASGVAPLPSGLKINDAAGIATCALTAYQSIETYVQKGARIFINGGSGGTGVFAIQIAKLLGCHVVASCSGSNAALCKDLGADEIIDYRSTDLIKDLASRGTIFDLVVDFVGKQTQLHPESVQFLKSDGAFVQVAASDDTGAAIRSMLRNWLLPTWLGGTPRRWKFIMTQNKRDQLLQIAKWAEDGKLKTVVDSYFTFDEAKEAYTKLKTGRARGKIVVSVKSGETNDDSERHQKTSSTTHYKLRCFAILSAYTACFICK